MGSTHEDSNDLKESPIQPIVSAVAEVNPIEDGDLDGLAGGNLDNLDGPAELL